jgi:hypothetical protein
MENTDDCNTFVDKIWGWSNVKKKNSMKIGVKLDWAVNDPKDGLLGFENGAPTKPNKDNPEGIDPINTSLLPDKGFQMERLRQSTLLQSDNCEVKPIINVYIMADDTNFPIKVGSDKGMDIFCDGQRFYVNPTVEA